MCAKTVCPSNVTVREEGHTPHSNSSWKFCPQVVQDMVCALASKRKGILDAHHVGLMEYKRKGSPLF
jgi:hypothetical protein